MPLQSQLIDEQGEVVEQILFTEIEIPADIPAAALEPTIDTTGFTTLRAAESDAARGRNSVARGGRAGRLQALGRDAEPDRGLRHSRRASRLFRRARDGIGVHRGSGDQSRSRRGVLDRRQHERLLADVAAGAKSRRWARCRGRPCARSLRRSSPSSARSVPFRLHGCSALGVVRAVGDRATYTVELAASAALQRLRAARASGIACRRASS